MTELPKRPLIFLKKYLFLSNLCPQRGAQTPRPRTRSRSLHSLSQQAALLSGSLHERFINGHSGQDNF